VDKEQLELMLKQAFERSDWKEVRRLKLVAKLNGLR
jgi:hypothetical protein